MLCSQTFVSQRVSQSPPGVDLLSLLEFNIFSIRGISREASRRLDVQVDSDGGTAIPHCCATSARTMLGEGRPRILAAPSSAPVGTAQPGLVFASLFLRCEV